MSRFLAVLVLAAVGLIGCGDGGGSNQSAYCKSLRDAAKEAAVTTTAPPGPSTTADYKALNERFDKALEKISSKAPADLEDDYKVVKEYFGLYLTALSNPGSDARVKLQQMATQYKTAQEAITKYNQDECNFSVTSTTLATGGAPTATTASATTRTP